MSYGNDVKSARSIIHPPAIPAYYVNGMNVPEVRLRPSEIEGQQYDVVMADALVGPFALTDDCLIEVKPINKAWKKVSVTELIDLLYPRVN